MSAAAAAAKLGACFKSFNRRPRPSSFLDVHYICVSSSFCKIAPAGPLHPSRAVSLSSRPVYVSSPFSPLRPGSAQNRKNVTASSSAQAPVF